ncbi:MAG: hypothetical protein MUF07_13510 [Steroidobacteraceae bacterium]|jgi:hypothetical protein|nr:hypothetical protein [Steroidobacteraceae bacterium]
MPSYPKKPYLADERFDQLARMMFQLLSEVWVMRDRMVVMEELLRRKGVASAAEIDGFVPDPELEQRLEVLRNELVEAVLGAPLRSAETVETLVARGRAARERGPAA